MESQLLGLAGKGRLESLNIFTEVFPINKAVIPPLAAYKLDVSGSDASVIGGKLAYRLRKEFSGHWVWTDYRVVTDTPISEEETSSVVESIWSEQQEIFRDLRRVYRDADWRPSPQAQADFVATGLFPDIEPKICQILSKNVVDLGNARVDREHEVRGWVVENEPAVSVSVSSHVFYKQDFVSYAKTCSPDSLIGMWVADRASSLKGEIVEVDGILSSHRKRLLNFTKGNKKSTEIIEKAPDDELVMRVLVGRKQYSYVASAFRLIVRVEDYQRFKINRREALRALKIPPGERAKLVEEISNAAKDKGLIAGTYNSEELSHLFMTSKQLGFEPSLLFGKSQVRKYDERAVMQTLQECGLYKKAKKFDQGLPIKLAVINTFAGVDVGPFLSRLQMDLNKYGFSTLIIGQEGVTSISRVSLEMAVERLSRQEPDIILTFFQDNYAEEDDETSTYHVFKSITLSKGIATQCIYSSTLDKSYARANIVLGILGKTGNVPFVLSEPLPYADMVVGIDIARERKKRLPGSINATAIARIYFDNGEFLRYVIHDAPLEGETIPDAVLQSMFPVTEFKGKRVIIHRDGIFRGDEKKALKSWAEKLCAQFYLVEVIKSGTPRLYGILNNKVVQPPKGSVFKLSDTEAFLVSSLPPFTDATPRPLRIRTDGDLMIEQALHSVLALTILHYGSLRPPRLPVSIHYSDEIAHLALKGVKPKDLEGSVPYWL